MAPDIAAATACIEAGAAAFASDEHASHQSPR
jgi:hypothetical protein